MNSRLGTMELVQRYHRANAYGSIITAALFIITIGEWFDGKLGIPAYAVLLVALVALVRWLLASRSLKDSPKYLNVEYGDYCGEASNRARGYAVMAAMIIMCLVIFLELWGGIFLLGSTVARLALSGFLGLYGSAYLILTADGNERNSEA